MKEIEYAARHVTLVFDSTLWASEQINREWRERMALHGSQ
jgi:hypothetical protein